MSFTQLIQNGAAETWLLIPSAILLGALHGLEPGHSKTMMTAFIVAIRGTVWQAVMLGIAATISHTIIVWILALIGLYYGSHWKIETAEPYLQLISGILIILIALWVFLRTWREHQREKLVGHHHNHFGHSNEVKRTEHHAYLNSEDKELTLTSSGYQDAHALAHANEIRRRFAKRTVTNRQIILFGLTGGLIPCSAAITILLLCLQLKRFILGIILVLCFSIGLALTLVLSGTIAALAIHHISKRWQGFNTIARRAPYLSSIIILIIGFYISYQGIINLTH